MELEKFYILFSYTYNLQISYHYNIKTLVVFNDLLEPLFYHLWKAFFLDVRKKNEKTFNRGIKRGNKRDEVVTG
jgi:hypothetical protein